MASLHCKKYLEGRADRTRNYLFAYFTVFCQGCPVVPLVETELKELRRLLSEPSIRVSGKSFPGERMQLRAGISFLISGGGEGSYVGVANWFCIIEKYMVSIATTSPSKVLLGM